MVRVAGRHLGRTLLQRAAGMLAGYYLHRAMAGWLGAFDGAALVAPEGFWAAVLPLSAAAVVAGYVAALVSGGSTRSARLLGIALAVVAILAALQRLEQGLPLLTGQVAQIVTSPLCVAGGALLERHRLLWRRRAA